jgi:hypothetical protein
MMTTRMRNNKRIRKRTRKTPPDSMSLWELTNRVSRKSVKTPKVLSQINMTPSTALIPLHGIIIDEVRKNLLTLEGDDLVKEVIAEIEVEVMKEIEE